MLENILVWIYTSDDGNFVAETRVECQIPNLAFEY